MATWMEQWVINTTHNPASMMNALERKLQRSIDMEQELLAGPNPSYAAFAKAAQIRILATMAYVQTLDFTQKYRTLSQVGGPMWVDAQPYGAEIVP